MFIANKSRTHVCKRDCICVVHKVHEEEENHTQPKAHTAFGDGPF